MLDMQEILRRTSREASETSQENKEALMHVINNGIEYVGNCIVIQERYVPLSTINAFKVVESEDTNLYNVFKPSDLRDVKKDIEYCVMMSSETLTFAIFFGTLDGCIDFAKDLATRV